jgi:hypothetical protein
VSGRVDRPLRLLGATFSLWDVRDVELHVRALLDQGLRANGTAYLSPAMYERVLTFLIEKCWELSGLTALTGDTKKLRYVWEVRGFRAPRGPLEPYKPIKLPQFLRMPEAEAALATLATTSTLAFTSIVVARPRGAYDPERGLAFCTYSRGILTKRITDWFRSELGDSRYQSGRRNELSLDSLVEQWEQRNDGSGADENYLDRSGPGSDQEFVDDLNRHAYNDPLETVMTREVLRAAVAVTG